MGREVYQIAREVRDKFNALYQIRDQVQQQQKETIVISYSSETEASLIIPELITFQARFPTVHLVLKYQPWDEDTVAALSSQHADYGIILRPNLNDHLSVLAEWPDALIVVMSKNASLTVVNDMSPFILPPHSPDSLREMVDQLFLSVHGHPPVSFMEIDSVDGLKHVVTATNRPAIMLQSSVVEELASGKFALAVLRGFPFVCPHVLCCPPQSTQNTSLAFRAFTGYFKQLYSRNNRTK